MKKLHSLVIVCGLVASSCLFADGENSAPTGGEASASIVNQDGGTIVQEPSKPVDQPTASNAPAPAKSEASEAKLTAAGAAIMAFVKDVVNGSTNVVRKSGSPLQGLLKKVVTRIGSDEWRKELIPGIKFTRGSTTEFTCGILTIAAVTYVAKKGWNWLQKQLDDEDQF